MPDSLGSLDVHCPFSIFHSLTFWRIFVGGDDWDASVFVAHGLTFVAIIIGDNWDVPVFVAHELTFVANCWDVPVFVAHELTLVANWTLPRSD